MEDDAPKENPPADFNKLDLSQLQGFSFGTQWTQDKGSSSRGAEGGERGRRDDHREGAGPERRDRRGFRRATTGPDSGPASGRRDDDRGERREGGFDRGGPRREPRGDFRGGPRRDFRGGGQPGYGRREPVERGPYESPYYTVTFYPEDTSFNTLVQTIRKSCRTIELFEIARTVVAKPERFVVVLAHKAAGEDPARAGAPAGEAGSAPAPRASKPVFYISVPDGMPFESEDAVLAHVMSKHLDKFFDTAEVEVDAPKGNFQVINRCSITGELLGPPNYHRYNQIVQQHYSAKIASRMSLEAYRTRIETVRDPEVVNQWLAKMKKVTRYTWKGHVRPAAAAPVSAEAPAEGSTETAPAESAPVPPVAPNFDALEDARMYLLSNARDKVVRTAETARFHGKIAEQLPPGEIRRAVEGALDRQRRFPLDTANALRGRLRREHFTIFKKGSKGVSYVCAVKRKFRVPGQTFSDTIGSLIAFIEANPMVRASELQSKFLGIAAAAPAPAAAAPADTTASDTAVKPATPVESSLTIEDRARLSRLQGDLMWLVREGYVTEFIDGRLFAPPPMVEARKREVEASEHDPENFPEAPAQSETATSAPAAATPVEAAAEPVVAANEPPAEPAPLPNPESATPAEAAAPVDTDRKPETPAV